jgi:AAT family amino acid transporter
MLLMFVGWKLYKRTKFVRLEDMDLVTDVYIVKPGELDRVDRPGWKGKVQAVIRWIF